MNILPTDIDYEKFVGLSESQHVRPAIDYREQTKEYFSQGDLVVGERLPWTKTHDKFRLRPGEVTIWGGINGHKKSLLTSMVMLYLPPTQKILIASLEMQPFKTLSRMARQGTGVNSPSDEYLDEFFEETNNIWLYDQQDYIPMERVLGMINYMAQENGIDHVVIDSLMMVVGGPDDYGAQKQLMIKLSFIAKTHNCHIHLVHHVRKGKDEKERINKFSVKGAGELVDLADNLILTQTNVEKEELKAKYEPFDPRDPDQWLMVEKQRHGEFEGVFSLYFDPASLRFKGGEYEDVPWRLR